MCHSSKRRYQSVPSIDKSSSFKIMDAFTTLMEGSKLRQVVLTAAQHTTNIDVHQDPAEDPSFNAVQYLLQKGEMLQPAFLDIDSWLAWVLQNLPSMFDFSNSSRVYWIRIRSPSNPLPHSNVYGKWMLFPKEEDADNTWITVALAMQHNLLGPRCKTNMNVTIIYTYDFRDAEDVLRVGLNLQRLFPDRTLTYKPDVFTASQDGIYGSNTIPRTIYTLPPRGKRLVKTMGEGGQSALDIALGML